MATNMGDVLERAVKIENSLVEQNLRDYLCEDGYTIETIDEIIVAYVNDRFRK